METNVQAQNEISLTDIFKMILRKIKVVLLALLGGILLGVLIGVTTTHNVDYYGTSAEFYVNPVKRATDSDGTDDTYNVYGAYGKHIMDNMVKLLGADIFAEQLALGDSDLPPEGINAKLDEAIAKAKAENTPENTKAAILEWRKTKHYKGLVSRIKGCVRYSYYDSSEAGDVDALAKSFIYVRISVLNDKGFASELYERVKKLLPEYVMEYMPNPDDQIYDATNCVLISTLAEVGHLNPTAEKDAIVKNTLIFGLLSAVIACVVVVLIGVADKRLMNYEATMEKFGMPVLGVIPMIEEEPATTPATTEEGGEEK